MKSKVNWSMRVRKEGIDEGFDIGEGWRGGEKGKKIRVLTLRGFKGSTCSICGWYQSRVVVVAVVEEIG